MRTVRTSRRARLGLLVAGVAVMLATLAGSLQAQEQLMVAVDVDSFAERARRWSEARRQAREAAVQRAEELAAANRSSTTTTTQAPPTTTAAPTTTATPAPTTAAAPAAATASTTTDAPTAAAAPTTTDAPTAAAVPTSTAAAATDAAPATAPTTTDAAATTEASTNTTDGDDSSQEESSQGVVPLPAGTTEAQWHALRECESRQDYRAVSRTGRYRGAYQFSIATWNWVAGMHYPHLEGVDPRDASRTDQDRMAYKLYEINGWDPWPTCKKRLPS